MKTFNKFIAATALTAGILAVSVPLAAGAHKKLATELKLGPIDTTQMMIDTKNLPVVQVAEPF